MSADATTGPVQPLVVRIGGVDSPKNERCIVCGCLETEDWVVDCEDLRPMYLVDGRIICRNCLDETHNLEETR